MEKTKEKEHQPRPRKPFRKPHLRIYGHISVITQAGGHGGTPDGAPDEPGVPNRTAT
jgi:hypothetical protein